MATITPRVGVFLTYAMRDARVAEIVRRELSDSSVAVFDANESTAGAKATIGDELRAELVESDAIIIIAHEGESLPSSVAFEVGAASAWHKPIFVVTDRPGRLELPSFLKGKAVFPLSRLDELARTLNNIAQPLSSEETAALVDTYEAFAVPVDKLIGDPGSLQAFSGEFNKRIGRTQPDSRIIQNLLRLRKRGYLAKVGHQ